MISLSNFVKKLRRDLMENRETGDTRETEEKKETKAKKKGIFCFQCRATFVFAGLLNLEMAQTGQMCF